MPIPVFVPPVPPEPPAEPTGEAAAYETGEMQGSAEGEAFEFKDPCCCTCVKTWYNDLCVQTDDAGSDGLMSRTYRVDVLAELCDGCTNMSASQSVSVSGSITRSYYISSPLTDGMSDEPQALQFQLSGIYFTGANSSSSTPLELSGFSYDGTPGSGDDCDGLEAVAAAHEIYLHLDTGGFGTPQRILFVHRTDSPAYKLFGSSPSYEPDAYTDFCAQTTTLLGDEECDPATTGIFTSTAEYVLTPCPPCALVCGGPACATAVLAGADAGSYGDYDGEYAFTEFSEWGGTPTAPEQMRSHHAPAGCVWRFVNDTGKILYLWVAATTRVGDVGDLEPEFNAIVAEETGLAGRTEQRFIASAAGDISCEDGTLSGTIDLVWIGDADEVTMTVTLGACATCGDVWPSPFGDLDTDYAYYDLPSAVSVGIVGTDVDLLEPCLSNCSDAILAEPVWDQSAPWSSSLASGGTPAYERTGSAQWKGKVLGQVIVQAVEDDNSLPIDDPTGACAWYLAVYCRSYGGASTAIFRGIKYDNPDTPAGTYEKLVGDADGGGCSEWTQMAVS